MRQRLQQIPHMDLVGFDIAGERVHHKIDAAAQGELVLVKAARAQPSDESLDVACGPGTVDSGARCNGSMRTGFARLCQVL